MQRMQPLAINEAVIVAYYIRLSFDRILGGSLTPHWSRSPIDGRINELTRDNQQIVGGQHKCVVYIYDDEFLH